MASGDDWDTDGSSEESHKSLDKQTMEQVRHGILSTIKPRDEDEYSPTTLSEKLGNLVQEIHRREANIERELGLPQTPILSDEETLLIELALNYHRRSELNEILSQQESMFREIDDVNKSYESAGERPATKHKAQKSDFEKSLARHRDLLGEEEDHLDDSDLSDMEDDFSYPDEEPNIQKKYKEKIELALKSLPEENVREALSAMQQRQRVLSDQVTKYSKKMKQKGIEDQEQKRENKRNQVHAKANLENFFAGRAEKKSSKASAGDGISQENMAAAQRNLGDFLAGRTKPNDTLQSSATTEEEVYLKRQRDKDDSSGSEEELSPTESERTMHQSGGEEVEFSDGTKYTKKPEIQAMQAPEKLEPVKMIQMPTPLPEPRAATPVPENEGLAAQQLDEVVAEFTKRVAVALNASKEAITSAEQIEKVLTENRSVKGKTHTKVSDEDIRKLRDKAIKDAQETKDAIDILQEYTRDNAEILKTQPQGLALSNEIVKSCLSSVSAAEKEATAADARLTTRSYIATTRTILDTAFQAKIDAEKAREEENRRAAKEAADQARKAREAADQAGKAKEVEQKGPMTKQQIILEKQIKLGKRKQ